MRRLFASSLARVVALAAAALAATALAQQPPKLEPLPEPPPPPPGVRDIPADEPRVRIAPREGDLVEEVREGGRVVMMRITPPNGVPYYLIDTTGTGNWMRRESLDSGVRVPQWTIRTFD
jgi:hypothetical protein